MRNDVQVVDMVLVGTIWHRPTLQGGRGVNSMLVGLPTDRAHLGAACTLAGVAAIVAGPLVQFLQGCSLTLHDAGSLLRLGGCSRAPAASRHLLRHGPAVPHLACWALLMEGICSAAGSPRREDWASESGKLHC